MWLWQLSLGWRRGLILAGTVGMTALVADLFARGFFVGPADWVVAAGGALIGPLCLFGHFSWLLWMIGFVGWRSRPKGEIAADTPITTRTAFVMPIYHEDTDRVAAGIRQTWASAKQAGLADHCDYFVLSDSVDPEIRRAEEGAVEALQPLFAPPSAVSGRLFLVRRADQVNYKAGNLANFLRHYGGSYDFMLVLDADSVMLGGRIRQLILKLQQRPRTAIIQSLMSTFRGATPFGQAMQFSVSRVGEIFMCGFHWFLGTEALYWGHNALIRTAPFAAFAQLPIYPGKPPLGGRVLSQDVHEAALLGRAGWDVELDLEPGGSFEEIPSNVISYGQRDQRWCTGDFLNTALILAPAFRTGQRVWLAYAVCSYAMSLVLIAMMLTGFALAARQGKVEIDATTLGWALLYMPLTQLSANVLLFWLHLDAALPLWRQVLSLFCELAARLWLTPLMVYQHATFVLGILLGKAVRWTSPSRDPADGVSWRFGTRVFWAPTLIAALWIPLAWRLAPNFLLFAGAILIPWLLSIPLAVASSNMRLGRWLAAAGIFATRRTDAEFAELGPLVAGTSDGWWPQFRRKPHINLQLPNSKLQGNLKPQPSR